MGCLDFSLVSIINTQGMLKINTQNTVHSVRVNKTAALQFTQRHCLYQNNHCTVLQTLMLPMRIMIADDGVSRMRMCVRLSVLLLLLAAADAADATTFYSLVVAGFGSMVVVVEIERLWNTGVSLPKTGA